MSKELKFGELTQKINGWSMKVHSKMKNGYNEVVNSRCLAIEFDKAGIKYQKELGFNPSQNPTNPRL